MAKKIQSKEQLQQVANESKSITDLARRLGYSLVKGKQVSGGMFKFLKGKIKDLEINISHFCGKGWSKGKCRASDIGIEKCARLREKPEDKVFCENSRIENASIYKRLIRSKKRQEKCERCNLTEWMGEKIRLQLHHKNGVNDDNREFNLEILCPNCHNMAHNHGRKQV